MWLIAGGTGQLGTALINELSKRSVKVVSTSSIEMDFNKPLAVAQLVEHLKPEVIINAAAYTNVDGAESVPDTAWRINADGAGNLAIAAKARGAAFAHVSTDYVFSGKSEVPYGENDLTGPFNLYGESKAAGEQNVMDVYPENSYIFRTAWLYSKDRKNFAKTITRKAIAGEEVNVVNDQIGQPTFASDVAERIVDSVVNKLPVGFYHATNSGVASWFEFAQEIYKLVGADINQVKQVESDFYPQVAKRPRYSVLSHQKWIDLGMSPMRGWKVALNEAMPSIISVVRAEG